MYGLYYSVYISYLYLVELNRNDLILV